MTNQATPGNGIKVNFRQAMGMLCPYVRKKLTEQVKAVIVIIPYLVLFQTIILGVPISEAMALACGLTLVIIGLAFFMEGLVLGLMPLGEVNGVQLPRKSPLPVILVFSFILGMGATFAEPAIGVLKTFGSSVNAWDAPLLFLLLTKKAGILVYSVGAGVGIAVMFGMLRFLYGWSLKPFIYILVPMLTAISVWGYFNPNIMSLTSLAWDCGAVTTGPVTVPLVLALGIGISRSSGSSGSSGFGVVTLASLFPILAVLCLGIFFLGSVPNPTNETDFLGKKSRAQIATMFTNENEMTGYVLKNAGVKGQLSYFDNDEEKLLAYLRNLAQPSGESLRIEIFGEDKSALERWAVKQESESVRMAIFGSQESADDAAQKYFAVQSVPASAANILINNFKLALQAIIPLSLFLAMVLIFLLREKLPRKDEVILGVAVAVIGMGIFNIGIELGLAKLGGQVGGKLPASFKAIELHEEARMISNFDASSADVIKTAIAPDGAKHKFFYTVVDNEYVTLPFEADRYDQATGKYQYVPRHGPLFGKEGGLSGIIVVLLFAFFMGYGATLAEPALNALGMTVEKLTVGTFKKSLLMQAVALGVGVGISLGVAKIIWGIPLVWMLAPPYMLLMVINYLSTEEFVNIGWDSAGVTTGPITVPLVLAMGLGIGSQVGVVEGFGILAMASVCPILSVLSVGLYVNMKHKTSLDESSVAVAENA